MMIQTTSDRRDSNFLATLVDGLNNSQNERDGYTRFGDSIDSFSLLDECENTNQRRGNILKVKKNRDKELYAVLRVLIVFFLLFLYCLSN